MHFVFRVSHHAEAKALPVPCQVLLKARVDQQVGDATGNFPRGHRYEHVQRKQQRQVHLDLKQDFMLVFDKQEAHRGRVQRTHFKAYKYWGKITDLETISLSKRVHNLRHSQLP